MSPMNNDNHKDYQTVLEEQTPLVCNDAVEKKSSSTRLAALLSIGIAVFAFLAMANSISELKSTLADHQSQLQALTVQSTPLLGAALQGSSADGDQCDDNNECATGFCQTKPYALCAKSPEYPQFHKCRANGECASKYCDSKSNYCRDKGAKGAGCHNTSGCISGDCDYQTNPYYKTCG